MDDIKQPQVKTMRWPDLSMYGLRLVSVKIPTGEWRLLMMGGDKFPTPMKQLGFRKSGGIWLKPNASITMNELSSVFKQVKVHAALPETEVYRIMRPKNRINEEVEAHLAATRQTPIGINYLGQEVFIGADGRFIRTGDGKVINMSERALTPSVFLRAESAEDLAQCADALVLQIDRGEVFRAEDMDAFAEHIFDEEIANLTPRLPAMHEAINHALARRMFLEATDAGRNTFNLALKLHEGLPPLTQDLAESITPLPLGVVAQRLANITEESTVYSPFVGNGALLSTVSPNVRIVTSESLEASTAALRPGVNLDTVVDQDTLPDHDITLVNYQHALSEEEINAMGTRTHRKDHADVMAILGKRSSKGRSVFMLKAGAVPGEVDVETRRLLSWISGRYQVESLVELDGSLFGSGGSANNRYLVVAGEAGQSHKIHFDTTNIVYDYESLWEWADKFVDERQRIAEQPVRIENSYQAPYIPASKIGQATTMIPRNLVGPVREALARTEQEFGPVDDFVSAQLQMSFADMEECFSPEQIDAIALAIAAHKHGKGFIEADQTGIGKGRVLAACARYAVLNNMPVVFMTLNPTLFSDFYRDIIDIKSEEILKPFLMNPNVPLIVDGKRVRNGSKSDEVKEIIENRALPANANLLMASYTQFNRDNRKNSDPKAEFLKEVSKGAFLILDESHAGAGESNTGFNVLRTLREVSGVVYSSATYAKDSANFRIYAKCMPPSVSPSTIPEILAKGGDPLSEVFSSMLAEDAVLIRREKDLSKLRFQTAVDKQYAERNEMMADRLAEILEGIGLLGGEISDIINERNKLIADQFEKLEQAKKDANPKYRKKEYQLRDKGWFTGNIGSRLYMTMRQFFVAIKTDFTADLAIAALEEGRKPIIALESTFESMLLEVIRRQRQTEADVGEVMNFNVIEGESTGASLDPAGTDDTADLFALMGQVIAESESGNPPVSSEPAQDLDEVLTIPVTFRDVLHKMLDSLTVVHSITKGKVDRAERIEQESVQRLHAAIEMKIDAFPDLYISPIDIIRQRLEDSGYTCGEISGRKTGIVMRPNGEQVVVPIRMGNKNKLIDAYNNGHIDAMVLTTAGSTGISLHASHKFKDQRQREVIEQQIANNVATRLQMFGRADRTGQVCSPIITTVDSGLPAETRQISMQNSKLRQMSANTTSNRDSNILDEDLDLLNKVGNEISRKFLLENLHLAKRIGVDEMNLSEDAAKGLPNTWYADQLTGRLGMLRVVEQRETYDHLGETYKNELSVLDAMGLNPFKPKEYDYKARIEGREEIYTPVLKTGSVFDRPVYLTKLGYDREISTLSSQDVLAEIQTKIERNFGDENPVEYMRTVVETMEQNRQRLMDRSWSLKNYPDLEAALQDEHSGAYSLKQRLDFIAKWATSIMPGNIITYTSLFEGTEQGIITSLTPPEAGREDLLGQYEFSVYVPEFGTKRLSLYSMYRDENFDISYDNKTFLSKVDETGKRTVKEEALVLDGNIFSACSWALEQGRGVSAIFTNEHGERCRGVVLPRDTYHVNMEVPFPIDRDVAYELLMRHQRALQFSSNNSGYLELSTSYRTNGSQNSSKGNSKSRIDIISGSKGFRVMFPKSRETVQFIDMSSIDSIRAKQFRLVKGEREKTVSAELSAFDLQLFIEEVYEGNATFFVPYHHREMVLDIYNELQARKAQSQQYATQKLA